MRNITLAILAGGAGSRMGGPKANLTVRERPILQYLFERFAWPGPTMLITAPGIEHPPASDLFDREVCDPVAGLGPLRGILTALEHLETKMLIVTTVDMPSITRPHLEWIAARSLEHADQCGILLSRRDEAGESIEPFPSIYRAFAKAVIEAQLAQNRRSVHGLLKCEGFVALGAPSDWPTSAWTNLNTPDDLRSFPKG